MEKTILFMDNRSSFLDVHTRLLERAGYQVLKATSIQEAEEKLEEKYIHLAILDIKMEDEEDELDISGLELAKKERYRPIPKIVLTAYNTWENAQRALGVALEGLGLVKMIGKSEGPKAILQAVEEVFDKYICVNTQLTIRWGEPLSFLHLVHLIEPDLDNAYLLDRASELEDLFRCLFQQSGQITIGRLLAGCEKKVVLTVFAFSESGSESQFIVACGQREIIQQEKLNYDQLAPKTISARSTVRHSSIETIHFAIITYTLTGADLAEITPLYEFYRENSGDRVIAAFDDLFNNTLAYWYQKSTHFKEQATLSEAFRACAQVSTKLLSRSELEPRIQFIQTEALAHDLPRFNDVLLNLLFDLIEGTRVITTPLRYGIIHRRFRDNILVDHQGRTWLSDFSQITEGPLVYDYVSLETMIKFDLLMIGNLVERRKVENYLQDSFDIDKADHFDNLEPDVKKTLQVINHIRRQARAGIIQEVKPYQVGLLFRTVEELTTYKLEIHYTRPELIRYLHSFLLVGLLCQELNSSEEDNLLIDHDNKVVKVNGKVVDDLTRLQFTLLVCLAENHGRICSRNYLLDCLFQGESYDRLESALDAHVSRLRKKIEPDPTNPRYIITVPGYGYKLVK